VARQFGYLLQFYRQEPGDVGINDIPVPADQNYEEVARKALLGYFNNPNVAPAQRPHHARVVTHDQFKTVVTLMATGPSTVEKVQH
jgi:hypothetical protein